MTDELKNLSFEEKMKILNKIHAFSDDDAKKELKKWETKMSRLKPQKDWVKSPFTKELRDLAMEQIKNIMSVLSNDENLTEQDRKSLFAEKRAHMTYLAILSQDPMKEIKTLEESADFELDGMDEEELPTKL